jgi:hypothetical protein
LLALTSGKNGSRLPTSAIFGFAAAPASGAAFAAAGAELFLCIVFFAGAVCAQLPDTRQKETASPARSLAELLTSFIVFALSLRCRAGRCSGAC